MEINLKDLSDYLERVCCDQKLAPRVVVKMEKIPINRNAHC